MSAYLQIRNYHRPAGLARAVEILASFGTKARVIAGGTDIVARRPGVATLDNVDHLVDISRLGLDYFKEEEDAIRIGAAANINAIGTWPLFSSAPYRALSESARSHSTKTIRNRATLGGNLCNASVCADLALPLLVLDASLLAAGPGGQREIRLENFFAGPNYSALDPAEIVLEIRIPRPGPRSGSAFVKLRRQQAAIDMAVVNAAVFLACSQGRCREARIALGAVAPVSLRAKKAESVLAGATLNEEMIQRAAAAAAEEARPIDDLRATAAYRKKMVAVLVRRALETSLRRCGSF